MRETNVHMIWTHVRCRSDVCSVHVRVLVRGHLISRRIAPEQALLTRVAVQPDCVARARQWALRALVVGPTSWPPD